MTRRVFLASAAGAAAQRREQRPNIVVIMADDLGFADIGCYGSEVRTPNLDAMARRGIRFTQFYNTARCCPTRASLLTGLYSHQAGIGHMTADWNRPGYRGTLAPDTYTIAEALKASGYGCYVSGKWHVTTLKNPENLPLSRGFDEFFGTLAGGGNYYYPSQLMRGNELIKPPAEGFFYTDAIADNALQFVRKHAETRPRDPFFLYAAFTAPHWPLHALEPEIARYRSVYREGWDSIREARYRRQIQEGVVKDSWPMAPRDSQVPAWADAPHKDWEAERMAVYAAQIDRLDQAVGRILEGVPDNTLVLFLSDNGSSAEIVKDAASRSQHAPFTVRGGNDPSIKPGPRDTFQSCGPAWAQVSNTPFRRYKMSVHEGGIASPLILWWKGDRWKAKIKAPGGLVETPAHVIDILPTCLEAAGASYRREKRPLEGVSLMPSLAGRPLRPHEAIFWEHEGNQAIREGRFKLVRSHGGPWELYDIEADRTESNNLAPVRAATVQRMSRAYDEWMRRAGVLPWDQVNRRARQG
jgi:arylsulfatase A-like enzyme